MAQHHQAKMTSVSLDDDEPNATTTTEQPKHMRRSSSWFKWVPTSFDRLAAAERSLLSALRTPYQARFVPIADPTKAARSNAIAHIWTLTMNTKHDDVFDDDLDEPHIVLIHGFGCGVGQWAHNLDHLAEANRVHAIDILGFGQSSRPQFARDPLVAEQQFANSIESWRRELNIKRMVLVGHSFGGFLAAAYALRYPHAISHLILADPWGLPVFDPLAPPPPWRGQIAPMWKPVVGVMRRLNPLASLRIAGPFGGPQLVGRFRPDLVQKFSTLSESSDVAFSEYIYHCNAQTPTGETAFKGILQGFQWAKHAMLPRMDNLHPDVKTTFIYGGDSWIDRRPGFELQKRRQQFVDVKIIQGSGHHVYVDRAKEFNSILLDVMQRCRSGGGPK